MKMSFTKRVVAWLGAGLLSVSVAQVSVAQDEARTLDQLVQMIRESRSGMSEEYRKREAEFQSNRAQQQTLLNQARATQEREETRSTELEQQFNANDVEIAALREQLESRLGALREMFGHLTSAAGDTRANLSQSIISAQYPGRTEFLDELIAKMGSDTRLPSIGEIERLWAEMTHEMAEAGKVVTFPSTVVQVDGEQVQQEVLRVGSFNLTSNGDYLQYNPTTGSVSVLARQPGGAINGDAADLQEATSGFHRFGIDPTGPTGGSFLSALINSPSLMERFHQGGLVGYIIMAIGAFGLLLAIWRVLVLMGMSSRVNAQLKSSTANTNNPLGRVLKVHEENPTLDVESLELKLHEAVIKERPSIEIGLNLLKIIAAVAPLLGLLGTVTGMIITFQAITIFGAGDPQAMAGGISQALVTTVQGLVVAIPMVLLHTLVNGRAQRVLQVLEEQSAGLVAEKAEKAEG